MRRCLTLSLILAFGCKEKVLWPEEDLSWVEPTTCPPQENLRIMVTNSGDDSVSWLENVPGTGWEVVCTEPVGLLPPEREGPHHGAARSDGSAYFVGLSNYVPGSGSGPHGSHGTGNVRGYLLKYDGRTHELVGRRLVDRSPGDVRLTPNEQYVLQSHYDLLRVLEYLMPMGDAAPESPNSRLAVIDPQTMDDVAFVEICPTSHGIGISADSTRAFVSCTATDEIAIVTLAPPWDQVEIFKVGTTAAPLGNPVYGPYAVAADPKSGHVWVSNTDSRDLRVFDGSTMVGTPIVTDPGAPFFGDWFGTDFVVALQGTNTLAFIDRTTHAVQYSDPLGGCLSPHAVLNVDDAQLLVACEGDHREPGTVVVVNPTTRVVDKSVTVGVFPDDLILVASPP